MSVFLTLLTVLEEYSGAITTIVTTIVLLVKPIRDKILGLDIIFEGLKCMLRSDMLHIYYKHREKQTIRQYEMENFIFLYKAYKRLGGNSFMDHIYKEVCEWEVLT